ncbi:hypothetical protein BJ684DRAFT_8664 [Piptocephalis cylindrospora]|uniref:GATOR2 complex protein MIO zinc-ribbon like domain-containing protein n=1 Tax=Piptocephalis cylindrospora TaxID=1907219 RepID=A0A4P9Y5S4_9FUNG|nr:hypothetical protein BJ684DRAFT_8664 [Piptocephalis cylindrospora]|eukprot:RKP14388.1 hypothetical protein BJ684DRAFT_8664 [Piptocephalis cylindrospora]
MGTPLDSGRSRSFANPEYDHYPSGFEMWFTWCQTCRHGGHAAHVLQWFQEHVQCPVAGCGCECSL